MIVKKRVRDQVNVFEVGKKLKQRVTRLRHQDFIARIAQKPEDERIALAGAGGENDLVSRDGRLRCSAIFVVGRYRLARRQHSLRIGMVTQGPLVAEGLQDVRISL